MQSLAGKVAIVTGAGSGIGQRIAHVMAERGAKILVAASREESASGTTKSIRDAGGIAESVYGDLADINVPEKIVQAAMEARSEEHTSELQSLMRISYAVFCLKKKKTNIFIIPD